jgi:transcriptional regulator with XRE-family HTH domain
MAALDAEIGARVRERRRVLGMTQSDLARALGVSYQQVHKFEAGKNRLAATQIAAVARILAVTPNQLLGVDPPAPDSRASTFVEVVSCLTEPQRAALLTIAQSMLGSVPATPGREAA